MFGPRARTTLRAHALLAFGLVLVAIAGCAEETYPEALWMAQHASSATASAGSSDASIPAAGAAYCTQAQATPLPQRLVTMSSTVSTGGNLVLATDLFQQFNQVCTPCHTSAADPPGQGGFQIQTAIDFATKMATAFDGALPIERVVSAVCPNPPNPGAANDPMPPCISSGGGTFAQRSSEDPIRIFAEEVQAWLNAGAPPSFTYPPASGDAGAGTVANAYALSPQGANAMTNLGTCIPSTALIGIDTQTMDAMDAKFAALQARPSGTPAQVIGLPEDLADTDLSTLDTQRLAQQGVLAYQPAYPLWSDNAGKMRYVRVPRGTSIHYNAQTGQFEIPPNTRFYKTFMRQIVDTDGSYRYQKVETRVIVARQDVNNPDGSAAAQTALFGTYAWKDDESDATLVETPLNDGTGFRDDEFLYTLNAPLAADVYASQPADPASQLVLYDAARHYAIPGSPRCIECHMGSPSQSFVLGFTPLQINRRNVGQGGIIETLGPDERQQLNRFIDAGIITGLVSADDAPLLEQSQGTRTPRNYQELQAQGYILGNCAHCHNPRGYPTVTNPVLAPVLDFLPSPGPLGGIFQFPLEVTSPRIFRGASGTTPMPYITPSLVDQPKTDPQSGQQAPDWFVDPVQGEGPLWINFAPWRSLIYRNVDNAFAYTDDYALFPHMPFNTAGYDPRAKEILGDWMVSIPAIRKEPQIVEYAYQTDNLPGDNIGSPIVDTQPQPYVEVKPGDPQYPLAVAAAQQRLATFHAGFTPSLPLSGPAYVRYADPGQTADILDPAVVTDPVCNPIPAANLSLYDTPLAEHPDWVITDLSQVRGPYSPRQPNWVQILVEGQTPTESTACGGVQQSADLAYHDQLQAIGLLQSATLDQISDYATKPIPFGLWQEQAGCNYAGLPTVQSFAGPQQPSWMQVANPPANAPVYSETPGAAIFKMICINCHGPDGAADGRLAQNLATMTGGNAIVADWRDGIFGPVGSMEPNTNRDSVFGDAALLADLAGDSISSIPPYWAFPGGKASSSDERAARYMAWMGLGGTAVNIPVAVLQLVSITKVLNATRTLSPGNLSANMLSEAKSLCLDILGPGFVSGNAPSPYFNTGQGGGYLNSMSSSVGNLNKDLIASLGDADMWLNLCSIANPPPVHMLQFNELNATQLAVPSIEETNFTVDDNAKAFLQGTMVTNAAYAATGARVGNDRGGVDSTLESTNLWPWCLDPTPPDPNYPQLSSLQAAAVSSGALPICPDSMLALEKTCPTAVDAGADSGCFPSASANQWAVRGAINAGMSVFLYMKSIENSAPPPDYDQCPAAASTSADE